MISIVACCHIVKLCALAARAFRSQHYEEEWWQHTPLSEYNTHSQRLWFNSSDTDTNFWAEIQCLHSQQQAVVSTRNTPQKRFTRNLVVFGIGAKISLIFSESENLVL